MDLSTYSDAELETLRVQIRAEQDARAKSSVAQAQAGALVEAVASGRASDPIVVVRPDGSTYSITVQPTELDGPSEWVPGHAYAAGAEVTSDGRRYEALTDTAGDVPPPDASSVWQGL